MTDNTVLITGANRGIGLAFTQRFAELGWHVLAGTRHPQATELNELARANSKLQILSLDLNDLSACNQTLQSLKNQPIDILLNNAGISGKPNQNILEGVDPDNLHQVYQVNTIAPIMMVSYLLDNLRKGKSKIIANITSRMGSIADNTSGRSYAYRSSKSALNSIMKSLQIDLQAEGFKVLLLHPGWVQTDMGGEQAMVTPEQSVEGMMKLILHAHDLTELFYYFEGSVLPF